MRTQRFWAAAATVAALVLSGCGTAAAPTSAPSDIVPAGPTSAVTAVPSGDYAPVTGPVGPDSADWQRLCHADAGPVDTAAIPGGPVKTAIASTFYAGEEANAETNANIDNIRLAWGSVADLATAPDSWGPIDPSAPGAYDTPHRNWYPEDGACSAGVTYLENPFYLALPTPDHDEIGRLTAAEPYVARAAAYLPELARFPGGSFGESESPFKNLWFEVTSASGEVAYGQLEDVGPSPLEGEPAADYEFVWGDAPTPRNEYNLGAGIDLSPALTRYLGTDGEGTVTFRAVSAEAVPPGPWRVVVTTAGPNWG